MQLLAQVLFFKHCLQLPSDTHLTIVEPQVQNSPKPQDKPYTTSFDAKFIIVNETPHDPDLWVVITHISDKLSLSRENKENILNQKAGI